jgi:hypothetical protein
MAITYDRPNVFGTLYVQSGEYGNGSAETADFDIDLKMLGTIYSITVTPTSSSFPTSAAAVAVNGQTAKVDFATAGGTGRWLAIGTRA